MAHAFQRQGPIHELITTQHGRHKAEYDFYRGTGQHAGSDVLVVLLNGWLGNGTMRHVAREVAWHGYDTVAPLHGTNKVRRLFTPNKSRSQDVHISIADAVKQTGGKSHVIVIDHSNGHQDAFHVARHLVDLKKSADEDWAPPYVIDAIGAVAGVSTNGLRPNMGALAVEMRDTARLFRHHPVEALHAIGESALNFYRNPVLAVEEGVGAAFFAHHEGMNALVLDGHVGRTEAVFLENDHVIVVPHGFEGTVYPGSHMTPICEPEVVLDVIGRLAA